MSENNLVKSDHYHKHIEDKLSEMLRSRDYNLQRNQKFRVNGTDGEYDIIAFPKDSDPFDDDKSHPKYALVFEVKRRDKRKRTKVITQLKKDNSFIHEQFGKDIRCFNFLVYSSKEYELGQTSKPYTIKWMTRL